MATSQLLRLIGIKYGIWGYTVAVTYKLHERNDKCKDFRVGFLTCVLLTTLTFQFNKNNKQQQQQKPLELIYQLKANYGRQKVFDSKSQNVLITLKVLTCYPYCLQTGMQSQVSIKTK